MPSFKLKFADLYKQVAFIFLNISSAQNELQQQNHSHDSQFHQWINGQSMEQVIKSYQNPTSDIGNSTSHRPHQPSNHLAPRELHHCSTSRTRLLLHSASSDHAVIRKTAFVLHVKNRLLSSKPVRWLTNPARPLRQPAKIARPTPPLNDRSPESLANYRLISSRLHAGSASVLGHARSSRRRLGVVG